MARVLCAHIVRHYKLVFLTKGYFGKKYIAEYSWGTLSDWTPYKAHFATIMNCQWSWHHYQWVTLQKIWNFRMKFFTWDLHATENYWSL